MTQLINMPSLNLLTNRQTLEFGPAHHNGLFDNKLCSPYSNRLGCDIFSIHQALKENYGESLRCIETINRNRNENDFFNADRRVWYKYYQECLKDYNYCFSIHADMDGRSARLHPSCCDPNNNDYSYSCWDGACSIVTIECASEKEKETTEVNRAKEVGTTSQTPSNQFDGLSLPGTSRISSTTRGSTTSQTPSNQIDDLSLPGTLETSSTTRGSTTSQTPSNQFDGLSLPGTSRISSTTRGSTTSQTPSNQIDDLSLPGTLETSSTTRGSTISKTPNNQFNDPSLPGTLKPSPTIQESTTSENSDNQFDDASLPGPPKPSSASPDNEQDKDSGSVGTGLMWGLIGGGVAASVFSFVAGGAWYIRKLSQQPQQDNVQQSSDYQSIPIEDNETER